MVNKYIFYHTEENFSDAKIVDGKQIRVIEL